jgi:hypothetical protein
MITCFPTSEVMVGKIGIGGNNPVRIQSMTNTDTLDTIATLDQIKRLSDTGCEIVRLAVPGIREARHLSVIKDELHRAGYDIPLIADVHFTPEAALISAELVEKVRINPGNYTDRKGLIFTRANIITFYITLDAAALILKLYKRGSPHNPPTHYSTGNAYFIKGFLIRPIFVYFQGVDIDFKLIRRIWIDTQIDKFLQRLPSDNLLF